MKFIVILFSVLISGCGAKEYREADNKVLCDPVTDQAYYVKPGPGEISYLQKNSNLNNLCIRESLG